MLGRDGIVDTARKTGRNEGIIMRINSYETVPDGTYRETPEGLARVERVTGYWVGLQTNTRAGRNAKFVGIWTASDGEKFVDPSRWVATLPEALRVAEIHDQIAIWDCQNGVEIYV